MLSNFYKSVAVMQSNCSSMLKLINCYVVMKESFCVKLQNQLQLSKDQLNIYKEYLNQQMTLKDGTSVNLIKVCFSRQSELSLLSRCLKVSFVSSPKGFGGKDEKSCWSKSRESPLGLQQVLGQTGLLEPSASFRLCGRQATAHSSL